MGNRDFETGRKDYHQSDVPGFANETEHREHGENPENSEHLKRLERREHVEDSENPDGRNVG